MAAPICPETIADHIAVLEERNRFGYSEKYESIVTQTADVARKILSTLPKTDYPMILHQKDYKDRLFRSVFYDPTLKGGDLYVLLTKTKKCGDLKLSGAQKAVKFAIGPGRKKFVVGVIRKNHDKHKNHWMHASLEIEIMKHLKGIPGVIQLISSIEEEEDKKYLLMEFCDGGDLCDAIFSGQIHQMNLKERGLLLRELFLAMKQIHEKGILHRDVKGENVFLHRGGIKFGDFGLGCFTRDIEERKIMTGTPSAMAPERVIAIDDGDLLALATTEASDMWGLGVILYQFIMRENVPWEQEFDREVYHGIGRIPINTPLHIRQTIEARIEHTATTNQFKRIRKPEWAVKAQIEVRNAPYPEELKALAADLLSFKPDLRPTAAEALARVDQYLEQAGFRAVDDKKTS